MSCYVAIAAAALHPTGPAAPPREKTPEEAMAAAIRETKLALASFYLVGAVFCHGQDQAVECWGKYLETKNDVLLDDFKRMMA